MYTPTYVGGIARPIISESSCLKLRLPKGSEFIHRAVPITEAYPSWCPRTATVSVSWWLRPGGGWRVDDYCRERILKE